MIPLDRDAHTRAAGRLPPALAGRAERGFADFERLPMPTPKDEDWRYVDIDFDPADFTIPESPGNAVGGPGVLADLGDATGRARSVDGYTIEASGGDDVAVTALSDASPAVLDGFEFLPPSDRVVAINDAFAFDGVAVHAAAGTEAGQVLIDLQAATPSGLVVPLLVVRADEQSSVSVVIEQRSPDGMPCMVVPRVEVMVGDAARVDLTIVQAWGDATVALANHRMRAGRDATAGLAEAGFGAVFSRLALDVWLAGRGASSRVVGAYFGDRRQTLDYRYFMRHAAPNTTSEMFLKGAVGDTARSVFTGLIRIEPEGQKTNAHQTNRNLVLSEGAEAHSVPNLEILADDVRCGHGSAVGPLDEDQRYYLMSRGLTRPRADRVQVKGFFEEALARFPVPAVVPSLRQRALDKYEAVVA